MAKKITDFKNPLMASSGSVLDWSQWTGGIVWVVMIGMIMAMGASALHYVDRKMPGSQTPNVKPFAQPVVESGYNVL